MTNPVVGSARVEFTADLSRFAAQATAQVRAAMTGVNATISAGLAPGVVQAGNAGSQAGQGFGTGFNTQAGQGVRNQTRFATAGTGAQPAGAQAGQQFGTSFNTAAASSIDDSPGGGIGSKLGGFARLLGGVAAGGLIATAGLTAFGLSSAASLETTTTAFTSLLGSSEAAQANIVDLQKFAASTPFEFGDLAKLDQQFLAIADSIGLAKDQIIPTIGTIGDLGAVTGASVDDISNATRAIGQIGSSGKVTLENLNQVSEAFPGFNAAAAIAGQTGQTTAEVLDQISAGGLDATTGIQALIGGMAAFPGAAGAMAAQSETLIGLFSTFKDTVSQTLTNSLQPLIPVIKDTLGQVTPIIGDTLASLGPVIAQVATAILPAIGPLVSTVGSLLQAFLPIVAAVITPLIPLISGLGEQITGVLIALGPFIAAIGPILAAALSAVTPLLEAVSQTLDSLVATGVIDVIVGLVTTLATTLGGVLSESLYALAPTITLLGESFGQILTALAPLLPVLADVFLNAILAIAPALPQLVDSLTQLALVFVDVLVAVSPILTLLPPLLGFLSQHIVVIEALAAAIVPLVLAYKAQQAVMAVGGLVAYIKQIGLVQNATKIWTGVQAVMNAVLAANPIVLVGIALAALVAGLIVAYTQSDTFRAIVQRAFQAVKDTVMAVVDFIVPYITTAWQVIATIVGVYIDIYKTVIMTAFNLVSAVISTAIDIAATAIGILLGAVDGAQAGISAAIGAIGGAIGQIGGFFSAAYSEVSGWVSQIVGLITGIPGAITGLAGQMLEAGKSLMSSLFDGLSNAGGAATDFAKKMVNALIDNVNKVIPHRLHIPIPGLPDIDVDLLPNIPHLANGGYLQEGPNVVGEGPNSFEIAYKQGNQVRVYSNSDSRAMFSGPSTNTSAAASGPAASLYAPITVYAPPGMDVTQLAKETSDELAWKVRR